MRVISSSSKHYAKAIFDLALRDGQLVVWQQALAILALIAVECEKKGILSNQKIEAAKKIGLFLEVTTEYPAVIGLVQLLAERKKLIILSDIVVAYRQLLFAHNKTLEVKVVSACELNAEQKERLFAALKQRYNSEILLQYGVDSELIGGGVIYILDRVIDHSFKGILRNLKQNLTFKEQLC